MHSSNEKLHGATKRGEALSPWIETGEMRGRLNSRGPWDPVCPGSFLRMLLYSNRGSTCKLQGAIPMSHGSKGQLGSS